MKKKKTTTTKEPLAMQPAAAFDRTRFVQDITERVIDAVNEARARKGLPPLK